MPGTSIAPHELPKPLLFALGELQRGVAEIPGPASNERIAAYLMAVGMPSDDDIAWCSAFVNWCVFQAGLEGTNKPNARSWLAWGEEVLLPKLGDIAIFRRGTSSWQGHVGFVIDVSPGFVTLLGGNQSDRVSVARYSTAELLGYRRAA